MCIVDVRSLRTSVLMVLFCISGNVNVRRDYQCAPSHLSSSFGLIGIGILNIPQS